MLKTDVLNILENNKGKAISGESIAKSLCVTRSAVWKAIKSLQTQGHYVVATTNKGYMLKVESDIVSENGIMNNLQFKEKVSKIYCYDVLDSSNNQAKKLAISGAKSGTVVVCERQTAGRGRMGRSFFSPPKLGVYLSIILCPKITAKSSQLITIYASLAVCKAIEKLTGLAPKIKWVNDVFLNNKKVCGILTEMNCNMESNEVENIIIGIGINCFTQPSDFPEEIKDIAGALMPTNICRSQLIAGVIDEILKCDDFNFAPDLVAEYKSRCFTLGSEIGYEKKGKTMYAKAIDINAKGNLVVADSNGSIEALSSGEISILKNKI